MNHSILVDRLMTKKETTGGKTNMLRFNSSRNTSSTQYRPLTSPKSDKEGLFCSSSSSSSKNSGTSSSRITMVRKLRSAVAFDSNSKKKKKSTTTANNNINESFETAATATTTELSFVYDDIHTDDDSDRYDNNLLRTDTFVIMERERTADDYSFTIFDDDDADDVDVDDGDVGDDDDDEHHSDDGTAKNGSKEKKKKSARNSRGSLLSRLTRGRSQQVDDAISIVGTDSNSNNKEEGGDGGILVAAGAGAAAAAAAAAAASTSVFDENNEDTTTNEQSAAIGNGPCFGPDTVDLLGDNVNSLPHPDMMNKKNKKDEKMSSITYLDGDGDGDESDNDVNDDDDDDDDKSVDDIDDEQHGDAGTTKNGSKEKKKKSAHNSRGSLLSRLTRGPSQRVDDDISIAGKDTSDNNNKEGVCDGGMLVATGVGGGGGGVAASSAAASAFDENEDTATNGLVYDTCGTLSHSTSLKMASVGANAAATMDGGGSTFGLDDTGNSLPHPDSMARFLSQGNAVAAIMMTISSDDNDDDEFNNNMSNEDLLADKEAATNDVTDESDSDEDIDSVENSISDYDDNGVIMWTEDRLEDNGNSLPHPDTMMHHRQSSTSRWSNMRRSVVSTFSKNKNRLSSATNNNANDDDYKGNDEYVVHVTEEEALEVVPMISVGVNSATIDDGGDSGTFGLDENGNSLLHPDSMVRCSSQANATAVDAIMMTIDSDDDDDDDEYSNNTMSNEDLLANTEAATNDVTDESDDSNDSEGDDSDEDSVIDYDGNGVSMRTEDRLDDNGNLSPHPDTMMHHRQSSTSRRSNMRRILVSTFSKNKNRSSSATNNNINDDDYNGHAEYVVHVTEEEALEVVPMMMGGGTNNNDNDHDDDFFDTVSCPSAVAVVVTAATATEEATDTSEQQHPHPSGRSRSDSNDDDDDDDGDAIITTVFILDKMSHKDGDTVSLYYHHHNYYHHESIETIDVTTDITTDATTSTSSTTTKNGVVGYSIPSTLIVVSLSLSCIEIGRKSVDNQIKSWYIANQITSC